MNERISALLDGELSARERDRLLQELAKNPESRAVWQRYHVIGAALRKDIDVVVSADLPARVLHRIENDPLPFARAFRHMPMQHFAKLAGGLAIAASVTAVAVFSFKTTLLPDPSQVAVSAPSVAVEAKTQVAKSEQDSSLNALLVKHNEFSPAASINGMMPYVRVVSHSGDQ